MPRIKKSYGNIEGTAPATKKDYKRIRYSIFFLTWNSNKSFADLNDPAFKELEAKAERYFERMLADNTIGDYITILKEGDTAEKIKHIEVDASFEIGGDKRMFHEHTYIRVDHYTSVKLDIDRIRKEVAKEILEGSYINVVASNDTTRAMKDYIHKYNHGDFPAKVDQ